MNKEFGKSEGNWICQLTESSIHTMALGSTQPLIEMCIRNLRGCEGRPARKADNLTATCEPIVENVRASKSHKPTRLHGVLQG
jgi:hypothetical protein